MKAVYLTLLVSSLLSPIMIVADSAVPPDTILTDTQATESEDSAALGASVFPADSTEPIYPMSPERYERLVSYSKFVNVWRFAGFFIGLAVLAVILFTGLSARFRNWSARIPFKFFALWVFLCLFMLADYLLNLPFSIYRGFLVERSYGFMNQTFAQWWAEDLLALLVSAVLLIVPVWFLYWVLTRLKRWWLWFSVGAIPLTVALVVIVPVVVAPLFNEFGPLKDKQLESEILALAHRSGIDGADVFEVNGSKQSTKVNAYVTGLFGTKRIVLYDTLIKNFTTDEIKFVMAHEMGHYLKHHIWWGLGVAILFILAAFWLASRLLPVTISRLKDSFRFERLGDYASLPLIAAYLSIFSFVFQPVTNAASRFMERQSDEYGMIASGVDCETAARTFDKLSVLNLSDPDPSALVEFWFYDHPSLKKRMEFARTWKP
ncbi:MAG: M48 family metallopeptidase [Candidatus Zixiibacteriota bacterium]